MRKLLKQIRKIINLTDHVDITSAQNYIVSNIEYKGANVWILIFAVVIASVGLNVNSIPVIIGAMLISPLMGPIMGVGLALGINDTQLLKASFKNLLIMTTLSIIASMLYFIVSPLALEAPTELLARTNPTIYDVFIALFGGLAVIIGVCCKEKGSVIAGAAIATALMPPLCTAGYGLANGNFMFFMGAFYLYFINSVFIALATFLTVRYLHFPLVKFSDREKQKKVHRSITIFTIILIIPSIYSAIMVIKENRFNQTAKTFVAENKNMENSYIYDYKIEHNPRHRSTITISIAGEELSQKQINKLYENLTKYNLTKENLIINQNSTFISDNITDKEVIKGIFEQNEQEIKRREALIAKMEEELRQFHSKEFPSKQIAKEMVAQHPSITSITLARGESVDTKSVNLDSSKPTETIFAIIKYSTPITEEEQIRLKNWLAIRLNVKSITILEEK